LTDKDKKKGSSSTMNSSQEDRELENLSSQIVDGELQVALDDANEAMEENAVEEDDVDAVTNDLGQALAHLGEENERRTMKIKTLWTNKKRTTFFWTMRQWR
jgi:ribosomal silencing factor RsfS